MRLFLISPLLITLFLLFSPVAGKAQINERVFATDYRLDPDKKGELSVELDNISFFKNNEFEGDFLKGYTLPGFWLQVKGVFQPLENIKVEAGLYMLHFWGADRYPNYAYKDISHWKSDNYQKGMRYLPFFRGQIALSGKVNLVLGHIYGGASHRLIEPLYNPELNLTADPETGLQLLYNQKWVDLDAWVNWESFIFHESDHQEAFTVGLSTRLKFNDLKSKWHVYMPVQVLAQHRGGEIDSIRETVKTFMNGSIGVGTVWNTGHRLIKNVNVELDALGYYQQKGDFWPMDNGNGLYVKASMDLYDFRVKASYWQCDNFISMFGSPFYGAISMSQEGMVFDKPNMAHVGLEYCRTFGKAYSIGIDLDVYHTPSYNAFLNSEAMRSASGTSFTAGIYFRLNPSFLIKKF